MGSEAAGSAPAAPAAPAAAGGGSMTMIIAVVVVAVIAVAAIVGYVMLSGGDDGLELSGQWTVSGGEIKSKMIMNNDTANTIWFNDTIPADAEVIDFDDPTTMPDGWDINDLGDGDFEIQNFQMDDANFGTVTGTYSVDGDTMTITMSGSGHVIEGTDYMEIEFDYELNLARA